MVLQFHLLLEYELRKIEENRGVIMKQIARFKNFLLFLILVTIAFMLPCVINAQKVDSLGFLNNTKLVETLDFSGKEWFQIIFNGNNELFLVTKDLTNGKWYYRRGNIERDFTPCVNSVYKIGILNNVGNLLAISCGDFTVELWDLDKGVKKSTLNVPKKWESNFILPYINNDGSRVLLKFGGLGEYSELWDGTNGKIIARLTSKATSCNCNRSVRFANGFSPNGKVVVVSFGGMTFLWNADNGKLLTRLVDNEIFFNGLNIMTHNYAVTSLLFNKEGNVLITSSSDGATAWDIETGKVLQKFKQSPSREIYSLALSPDENSLVTGGYSNNIRLWDLKSGKLLWKSSNVKRTIEELFFSPDGTKVLSRADDRVLLWEASTGKLLYQHSFADEIFPRFSPNWKQFTLYDKKTKKIGLYESQ